MAMLELKNIGKSFGRQKVLDGISLAADKGETIVLFGPSGSGKSVLLRLVAGVIDPDEGQVFIGGADMTGVEAEERGVGMAFQNFALFPHMDAFTNIASPLEAERADGGSIRARVGAVARLLKIDHVLSHRPRALSNGQKQRTALARALVGEPPVLLLDDPLRNVDAKLRFEMRLELPRLLADRGATVVYVTQDYKEAMAIGDRIAVLRDGRIVQIGTPQQIYQQPATVEIARLFGDPTINLLGVEPKAAGDALEVAVAGVPIRLAGESAGAAAGRPCLLGLRPEAIHFAAENASGAIPVDIAAETPLNEKTVTLATLDGGGELLISRPAGTPGPAAGRAHVTFDRMSALLFDRESGERIGRRAA
jgi:multiple sugar transport system ATP-binding protein